MPQLFATANSGTKFEKPTEGTHTGVLVEVKDLGVVPKFNKYKNKIEDWHGIRFRWEVDERDKEGRRKAVFETFTLSLGDKARLKPRVASILGKDPGKKYDVMLLQGVNMQLVVAHVPNPKDADDPYANVVATLRLAKGAKTLPVVDTEAPANDATEELSADDDSVL